MNSLTNAVNSKEKAKKRNSFMNQKNSTLSFQQKGQATNYRANSSLIQKRKRNSKASFSGHSKRSHKHETGPNSDNTYKDEELEDRIRGIWLNHIQLVDSKMDTFQHVNVLGKLHEFSQQDDILKRNRKLPA